ncbi:MAG TPA: YkgJ family cysteine cluster protein [Rhizomicrobium sp.]
MSQSPERGCGPCNACCEHLKIDHPELQKPAGALCGHYGRGGCGIYEHRPSVCQAFFCGWRQLDFLGEDWRPDNSGILMVTETSDIPPGYGQGAVKFILLDLNAVFWPPLVERIAHLVEQRLPVFLQVNDHPNQRGEKLFLSEVLRPAVATRHYETICAALRDTVGIAIQSLKRQALPAQPVRSAYTPFR